MPQSANLRLGSKCNENCLFCTVADDHEAEMTTEQIKNVINSLSKGGVTILIITGGEPTLRKDLPELINHARKSNIKTVDLQTNAVMLSDESCLLKLKRAGLNYVTVGFPSHKKEVYNYLTQSNFYEKAIEGINNCIKNNIQMAVYHVINKKNYKDVVDFIKFIQLVSAKIEFAFAFLRPNGNTLRNPHIVPKLTEIEVYLHEMFEYCKSKWIFSPLEGVPLCYMQGFENLSAETRRMMQPAVKYISGGKVQHKSLHRDINKCLKRKSVVCKLCQLNDICAGVWKEYADLYGVGELFPVFKNGFNKQKNI